MAKTMTASDLEALDRLEQKVRLLVTDMGRLRAEQAAQAQENRRIAGELDAALARLAEVARGRHPGAPRGTRHLRTGHL